MVVIYVKGRAYGERLLQYFLEKEDDFDVILVTKEEHLRERLGENPGCVLAEDTPLLDGYSGKIVWLTSKDAETGETRQKYVKAEEVYQLVKDTFLEPIGEQREMKKGRIICVFSPEDGSIGVRLGIQATKEYLERQKAIFISLSGFPVYFGEELKEEPDNLEEGLGDILFFEDEEQMEQKIDRLTYQNDGVPMLVPVRSYHDLLDVKCEDLSRLCKVLCNRLGYEKVILQFSQVFEHTMDLLEICDVLMVPRAEDLLSKIRINVFRKYLRMEGREKLLHRMKVVDGCR